MPSHAFAFKKFTVKQDKCSMKITTDSVVLGAWANPENAKTILDLGTGTGIIALMLAQRSGAKIDTIDICGNSCIQAMENFVNSPWGERIAVIHSSIQDYSPLYKYDLMISNPPFFPCPKTHREKPGAQAKYTHKLSFDELLDSVMKNLSPKGAFCTILPIIEGSYFTNDAEKQKLFLNRFTWVKTTARRKFPKRILMQFSRTKTSPHESILVISNENGFTKEYRELTKEYYKKF